MVKPGCQVSTLKASKVRTFISMISLAWLGIGCANGYDTPEFPRFQGGIQPQTAIGPFTPGQRVEFAAGVPIAVNVSAGLLEQTSPASSHSVKLSWTASVPATRLLRDAVTGYRIYRSTSVPVPHIPQNMIVCAPVSLTSCVDKNVVSGQTYYYVATAVAGSGKHERESGPSKPATATIP
jgi:hypothetical protein